MNKNKYNSDDLTVLEGVKSVQKRAGRYIGSLDSNGLHHLLIEVLDNCVDECISLFADTIFIKIKNRTVLIEDNGRGIPIDKNKKYNMSGLKLVLTKENSGGKFNNNNYVFSSGLHGVGSFVVNALSSECKVKILRNYNLYELNLKNGYVNNDLNKTGDIEKKNIDEFSNFELSKILKKNLKTGTSFFFIPSYEYFDKDTVFDREFIYNKLNTLTRIHENVNIFFQWENEDIEKISKDKFISLIPKYNIIKKSNDSAIFEKNHIFNFINKKYNIKIIFSFNFLTDDFNEYYRSFVNTVETFDNGSHVNMFKNVFLRFCKDIFLNKGKFYIKDFLPEDSRKGIIFLTSIYMHDPIFSGQIKHKLTTRFNNEITSEYYNKLKDFFINNVTLLTKLKKKIQKNISYRKNLDKTINNLKKDKKKSFFLPAKLVDCYSENKDQTELFIVEGNSAGGSAEEGRDKSTQAILALKGKPINVFKNELKKIYKNEEIVTIFNSLGYSIGDKDMDIEKLRYGKVIILADADPDGKHISILHLGIFFKFFKNIIDAKKLFIALPPLYGLVLYKKFYVNGKKMIFCFNNEELERNKEKYQNKFKYIQYFKGLGEMNADELAFSSLNVNTRKLFPVVQMNNEKNLQLLLYLLDNENNSKEFRRDMILKNFCGLDSHDK